jgi:hypothetical protein
VYLLFALDIIQLVSVSKQYCAVPYFRSVNYCLYADTSSPLSSSLSLNQKVARQTYFPSNPNFAIAFSPPSTPTSTSALSLPSTCPSGCASTFFAAPGYPVPLSFFFFSFFGGAGGGG